MYSKKVQPGEVRDDEGRRRFHGAFTGGFSAGYYNSVGSEEGWTPSTFVSSRDKRANVSQQRAEDFMDEEDGLLGKQVRANAEYDTLGSSASAAAKSHAMNEARSSGSLIPGAAPMELMVVSGQPIGKRLLQTMGWREGTGVGARVKRRSRQMKGESDDEADGVERKIITGGVKQTERAGSKRHLTEEESGGSVAELLGATFTSSKQALGAVIDDGEITFAPDDAKARIRIPKPKNDSFGIGYDPYKENPELEHARRGHSTTNTGVYRMGMGVASGSHVTQRNATGFAIDDGEDDVYDSGMGGGEFHALALIEEEGDDQRDPVVFKSEPSLPDVFRTMDDLSSLPGFVCPKPTSSEIPVYWEPPPIPRSWRPVHQFTGAAPKIEERKNRPSVAVRQKMLGDQPAYRPSIPPRQPSSQVVASSTESVEVTAKVRPLLGRPGGAPFALNPALAAAMKSRFASSVEVLKPDDVEGGGLKHLIQSDKLNIDMKLPAVEVRPVISIVGSRETTTWIPQNLLCKRFNVPPPTSVKSGSVAQMDKTEVGVKDRYHTHVAPFIQPQVVSFQEVVLPESKQVQQVEAHRPKISSSQLLATIEHGTPSVEERSSVVDIGEMEKPKPAVDFFKAIFEPSDQSSSEEEEEDEMVQPEESSLRVGPPPPPLQQPFARSAPTHIVTHKVKETPKPLPKEIAPEDLYAMLRQGDKSSSDSDESDKKQKKKHKKRKHSSEKKKKKEKKRKL